MTQINNSYSTPQPIAKADTNANVANTDQKAQAAEGAWTNVGQSAASMGAGVAKGAKSNGGNQESGTATGATGQNGGPGPSASQAVS